MIFADTKNEAITKASVLSHRRDHSHISPSILKAIELRKSFGGLRVLNDVDLELRQGEVVLLRGENGSGKTTLLNILTGIIEPDAGSIYYLADGTPRTYSFPRHWWQELNPFDHFTPEFVAQEGMGRMWQDVRLFGALSLRDNIAVAAPSQPGEKPLLALLAPGGTTRREAIIAAEADALLARLGLAGREASSADKISLGQSKRVAIARTVAAGARILFLDEPLAGLDHRGIADILTLLKSLVRDHSVTIVIVEHVFNQIHLRELVTTDWLLANGKLTVTKPESTINEMPIPSSGRPEWVALLASDDAEIQDERLARGAVLTRIRQAGITKTPSEAILEIRDLIVNRGPRIVIGLDDQGQPTGFNLSLYEGEIAILQAPNGWGKSTLFAAMTGLIAANSGVINLKGERLDTLPAWERVKRGLHALPSDQHSFPNLKAKDVLKLAGRAAPGAELESLADRTCASLSGGQRQRVALASLPLRDQSWTILLDEPFSMLDSAAIANVASKLRSSFGKTLLILSPLKLRKRKTKGKHRMNKRTLLITIGLIAVVAAALFIYASRNGGGTRPALTVSVSLPLTGPIANSGKLFQDAAAMAIDDLKNETASEAVAFDWNDNAGAPAQAATVAQRQITSDASLFFVGYTAETLATKPILAATGKPLFAFSFLASITQDPLVYRNSISYKLEYPLLVEYIKKRQAKKIAVIFVDLPESHEEFKQFLIPELVRSGWNQSDFALFPYAVTESEFRTVVAKVGQGSPDLIIINGFQNSLAPIIQSLRSFGLVRDGNVIGDFNTVDVPRLIGNEAMEGIAAAAPSYLVHPSQKASDFQSRYEARFGRPPSYSGFTGYDMALIAADLARRLPGQPTPQQINEELQKTDIEGVSGRITFDSDGDVTTAVETIIFRGGKLTPIKTP